jgi:hypothetical protein
MSLPLMVDSSVPELTAPPHDFGPVLNFRGIGDQTFVMVSIRTTGSFSAKRGRVES